MKLWLLNVRGFDNDDIELPPNFARFGDTRGFIVRAPDEKTAREIAGSDRDSGPWWLNELQTSCLEIRADGPPGVVFKDVPTG